MRQLQIERASEAKKGKREEGREMLRRAWAIPGVSGWPSRDDPIREFQYKKKQTSGSFIFRKCFTMVYQQARDTGNTERGVGIHFGWNASLSWNKMQTFSFHFIIIFFFRKPEETRGLRENPWWIVTHLLICTALFCIQGSGGPEPIPELIAEHTY